MMPAIARHGCGSVAHRLRLPALALLVGAAIGCAERTPQSSDAPGSTSGEPKLARQWLQILERQFPRRARSEHVQVTLDSDRHLRGAVRERRRRPALDIELPTTAEGTTQIWSRERELGVEFRLVGAQGALADVAGDTLVYGAAGPEGADLALRVGPRGVEDFVRFCAPPTEDSLSYEVELHNVHALRLVSDTVEYLDPEGVPRLRTLRPVLKDSEGAMRFGQTALSGCGYDADPRPPRGRRLVVPGAERCELRVSWQASGLEYPVTLDPGWVATDDLADARSFHTATLLNDGAVLVTGGQQDGMPLSSCELYDDRTGTWSMAEQLSYARYLHTATLLDNGNVIVLGGYGQDAQPLDIAESYNGAWTTVARMPEPRAEHTATLLSNGSVVVLGGGGLAALTFNPSNAAWTSTGTATTDRYGHQAVWAGGRVLAIGGSPTPIPAQSALSSVEGYYPSTGEFQAEAPMNYGRHGHTATVVDNDQVLVVGKVRDAEVYSPLDSRWEITASPPAVGRWLHAAVELTSEQLGQQVLFVGGLFGSTTTDSSEFFSPAEDSWTLLELRMQSKRFAHRATALNPGAVLLSGGQEGFGEALAVTEKLVFVEPGGSCEGDGECFTGHCADGVCCESACDGGCEACSMASGSARDGSCDILPEGISCWAGVGVCAVQSSCDGSRRGCQVAGFETDGDVCDDQRGDTSDDRCQQGICRGTPQRDAGANTGGSSSGSAGAGVAPQSGGSAGAGGASESATHPDEPVPTPLSCTLEGGTHGESRWLWWLLALPAAARRLRRPSRRKR